MTAELVIRLPDVGEGVAEAELVEWHVAVGDPVREDAVLAAVMTDKATVEIPSPAGGKVLWLGAEVGDRIPVGAPLIRLEVAGDAPGPEDRAMEPPAEAPQGPAPESQATAEVPPPRPARTEGPAPRPERPLASPAVRLRAREAGIDQRQLRGTGPAGRITHEDLDQFLRRGPGSPVSAMPAPDATVEEIRVIGLRRRIAERMERAHARIVPITYVEEVDVTELEALRSRLNASHAGQRPKLTLLPFLMRALVAALRDHPRMNAHYDDEAGILRRFGGIHIGIATQTDSGLLVPVLRHAETRGLWDLAAELGRLTEAARTGIASREELSGSTITVTSLGALGGIATTPVINHPEVAIIGVNRIAVRPHWDGRDFVPRKMMNLSSSFDHRVIDGWDAAIFIQQLRSLLESPATIFIDG
jgi:2-oxoisovalerate dehydrogenase E2 component (dihydrolipoyl transacylase)